MFQSRSLVTDVFVMHDALDGRSLHQALMPVAIAWVLLKKPCSLFFAHDHLYDS